MKVVVALKALDTRAPTPFPTFLILDLVVLSLCLLQGLPKSKVKARKGRVTLSNFWVVSNCVAQDAAPEFRDGKHKMGSFGPGSEIGTRWKAGLGKLGW